MGELIDRIKGKFKRALGLVTGSEKLEREGRRDELAGGVKGAVADAKGVVKDAGQAVKDAGRAVKDAVA